MQNCETINSAALISIFMLLRFQLAKDGPVQNTVVPSHYCVFLYLWNNADIIIIYLKKKISSL